MGTPVRGAGAVSDMNSVARSLISSPWWVGLTRPLRKRMYPILMRLDRLGSYGRGGGGLPFVWTRGEGWEEEGGRMGLGGEKGGDDDQDIK